MIENIIEGTNNPASDKWEYYTPDNNYCVVIGRHFHGIIIIVLKKTEGGWIEIGSSRINDSGVPQENLLKQGLEIGKKIIGTDEELELKEVTFSGAIAQTPCRIPSVSKKKKRGVIF